MVDTIENYYKDKISMLKDRIDSEKFERELAQQAQKKALSQMKKELDGQKRRELERYVQLLQQEDDKYDVQNMDLGRLESEIVKLYRKRWTIKCKESYTIGNINDKINRNWTLNHIFLNKLGKRN